jgi:Flp pilus assembly protein TadG
MRRIATASSEGFAFGWRSAFSSAIHALQSPTALAAEVIKTICSESPQTPAKGNSISKVRTAVASRPLQKHFSLLCGTEAAALIEFAVALPLLVVLVVGIFDFGAAFNLKQELNNAVREGARFGAAQPSNDISPANLKPPSVDAIRFLVDSYLKTAQINDCGLSGVSEPNQGGGMIWVYNASSGCPGTLTLTISRAVPVQVTPVNQSTAITLFTTVQISYPFQWHFNNVIQLLVPGASYAGVTYIPSGAAAANAD